MFNPSTGAEVVHMLIGAVMVVGFSVASVYAVGMLRGRRDRYHRLGLLLPLTAAVIAAPVQIVVGDWIANVVAEHQPVKLAAMEGHYETSRHVALSIGGIYIDNDLRYEIAIPYGLSLLVDHDPNGEVIGLDSVPAQLRPPVNITHLSYNAMVGIGFGLAALAAWTAFVWWRRRDMPQTRWYLRAVAVSGIAAVVALEAGWVATEVGRQPWIVYRIQLTSAAVSTAPGLRYGFYAVFLVYTVLTGMTVYVLRRIAGRQQARAPQEAEPSVPSESGSASR
jgi:cytochrome d ubiquinol oxidase subunit I